MYDLPLVISLSLVSSGFMEVMFTVSLGCWYWWLRISGTERTETAERRPETVRGKPVTKIRDNTTPTGRSSIESEATYHRVCLGNLFRAGTNLIYYLFITLINYLPTLLTLVTSWIYLPREAVVKHRMKLGRIGLLSPWMYHLYFIIIIIIIIIIIWTL